MATSKFKNQSNHFSSFANLNHGGNSMRTIKSEERLNSNSYLQFKEGNCLLRRRVSSPEIPHVQEYHNFHIHRRESYFSSEDGKFIQSLNSYSRRTHSQVVGLSKKIKLGISKLLKHSKGTYYPKLDLIVNSLTSLKLNSNNDPDEICSTTDKNDLQKEKQLLRYFYSNFRQLRKEKWMPNSFSKNMTRKKVNCLYLSKETLALASDEMITSGSFSKNRNDLCEFDSDFSSNDMLMDSSIHSRIENGSHESVNFIDTKSNYMKHQSNQINPINLCRSVPWAFTSNVNGDEKNEPHFIINGEDFLNESENSELENTVRNINNNCRSDKRNINSFKERGEETGLCGQEPVLSLSTNAECESKLEITKENHHHLHIDSEKNWISEVEYSQATFKPSQNTILNSKYTLKSNQSNSTAGNIRQLNSSSKNEIIIHNAFPRDRRELLKLYSSNCNLDPSLDYKSEGIDYSGYKLYDFVTSKQNEEKKNEKKRNQFKRKNTIKKFYCNFSLLVIGKYSQIYQCHEKAKGDKFAVKVICKSLYGSQSPKISQKYGIFKFLKDLSHPHIVKVKRVFEDEQNYYIVMDICHGRTLNEFFMSNLPGTLNEIEIRSIVLQILLALDVLHSNDLVHGDIKLQNLMFKEKDDYTACVDSKSQSSLMSIPVLCLIDLDSIRDLNSNRKRIISGSSLSSEVNSWKSKFIPNFYMESGYMGTAPYMSPESHDGLLCTASDMWSCGILLYALFDGNFPFHINETLSPQLRKQITINQPIYFNPEVWARHTIAWDLCYRLLDPNPMTRIQSAREALIHEWFSTESEVILNQHYN